MTHEEAKKKSFEVKWKTKPCHSGEECWCRIIVPETPIVYDNFAGSKEEYYIIGYGEVDKETAEHIINLHNKSLKDDK